MTIENIRLLKSIPLFGEFSSKELAMALLSCESRLYKKKDLIIREETEGEALYVIKKGRVKITKYDGHGVERELAALEDGETFGELALIENQPRSASVRAEKQTECLRLPRREFENLLRNHKEIERKFYKAFALILADRLRKSNDSLTFCKEMGDLLQECPEITD